MWLDPRWLWTHVVLDYVHGGRAVLASMGLLAAVFATSALIELAAVGWRRSSLARLAAAGRSARCDVVSALAMQTPLIGHLGVLMSGGLSLWALHVGVGGLRPLLPAGPAPWLHALACVVVVDFFYYWLHRAQHRWEPLWQLHRFHHVAQEATLLTALRVHPLESAFCGMCLALPLGLLGGDGNEVPVVFFVTQVLAMLRHGNLPWTWGAVGRYLLVSPAAHRVHHAADPACFDRNFGVLMPCWDLFFGTWREPEPGETRIGVPGDELARRGWVAGVWTSYRDFLSALGRAAKAASQPLTRSWTSVKNRAIPERERRLPT
jgi:sterol desaturase/sphingolipid hydroxylase (fatty acid hydroxylase superfamily)